MVKRQAGKSEALRTHHEAFSETSTLTEAVTVLPTQCFQRYITMPNCLQQPCQQVIWSLLYVVTDTDEPQKDLAFCCCSSCLQNTVLSRGSGGSLQWATVPFKLLAAGCAVCCDQCWSCHTHHISVGTFVQ
jgi:hypothetical protein